MMTDNIKALVSYRLEQATESLAAGKLLLEQGLFRQGVREGRRVFERILAVAS